MPGNKKKRPGEARTPAEGSWCNTCQRWMKPGHKHVKPPASSKTRHRPGDMPSGD
jgi:hypothetical protein